jgi:hypothetical protein
MNKRHLIEPENVQLWLAATFIIALLALVIGLANMYRTATATVLTQAQYMEHAHIMEHAHEAEAAPMRRE